MAIEKTKEIELSIPNLTFENFKKWNEFERDEKFTTEETKELRGVFEALKRNERYKGILIVDQHDGLISFMDEEDENHIIFDKDDTMCSEVDKLLYMIDNQIHSYYDDENTINNFESELIKSSPERISKLQAKNIVEDILTKGSRKFLGNNENYYNIKLNELGKFEWLLLKGEATANYVEHRYVVMADEFIRRTGWAGWCWYYEHEKDRYVELISQSKTYEEFCEKLNHEELAHQELIIEPSEEDKENLVTWEKMYVNGIGVIFEDGNFVEFKINDDLLYQYARDLKHLLEIEGVINLTEIKWMEDIIDDGLDVENKDDELLLKNITKILRKGFKGIEHLPIEWITKPINHRMGTWVNADEDYNIQCLFEDTKTKLPEENIQMDVFVNYNKDNAESKVYFRIFSTNYKGIKEFVIKYNLATKEELE